MTFPATMALEINEATYSIAVACLPPAWATIPFDDVLGTFLVINEIGVGVVKKNRPMLTVSNSCYEKTTFYETYVTGQPADLPYTFVRVKKIA